MRPSLSVQCECSECKRCGRASVFLCPEVGVSRQNLIWDSFSKPSMTISRLWNYVPRRWMPQGWNVSRHLTGRRSVVADMVLLLTYKFAEVFRLHLEVLAGSNRVVSKQRDKELSAAGWSTSRC